MEPDAILPCRVRSGHFSDEFGVTISSTEGDRHSFIADRTFVAAPSEPENGEEVDGEVYVSVLRREADSVLIQLPALASTTSRVWVHRNQVRAR